MPKTIILFFLFITLLSAQNLKITGTVFNEETQEPIPYVNIRIAGTTQGTSSNFEGKFILTDNETKLKLIFTAVGFKKKVIDAATTLKDELKIYLKPEPIQFMEIVVGSDEDPAYRIVREAIKRKEQNRAGLKSLEYDIFSKDIFLSSGEVAMISERFSTGYYQINKLEKIITHSVHISENEKKNALLEQNILLKKYVDFTADSLSIIGNNVFLPLAKNAFDWYDYKLLEVKQSGSVHECYIEVIPKSQLEPLLSGKIVIEDSTYSLKSIQLKSNDGLRFPYLNNLKVEFIQNRDRFNNYWLPTYFKVETGLKLNFAGLIATDDIYMNQVSMFTNYKINPEIPDSIYNTFATIKPDSSKNPKIKYILTTQLSRAQIDSLRPIPLTKDEVRAYKELDSTKTVVSQIKFTGLLSGVVENAIKADQKQNSGNSFFYYAGPIVKYLNFKDNRASGLLIGGKYNNSFFDNTLSLSANAGYGFGRKAFEGNINAKINVKLGPINGIEFGAFDEVRQWQIFNPYPDYLNGINVLLGFEDQFNYYLSKGFSAGINNYLGRNISLSIKYVFEKEESLPALKYQSIFNTNRLVKLNPNIAEGHDGKISVNILMGKNPQEYQPMLSDGLIARLDISNPILGSDFNYKRVRVISQLLVPTIYKELFSSPYLLLGFDGAAVIGDYGPQHTNTPNTALNIYSPFLSFKGLAPYEYIGDKMIALHLEHNWRTIPYQAIGFDFLSDLNIDLITGFSVLKTWNESTYFKNNSQEKIYWEGYLSFGKILGLGRIDFSYGSNNKFVVRIGLSTIL